MAETLPASPAPDVNIKKTIEPNLKVAQFGDGYSQRAQIGMNQTARDLSLSYTNISTVEKDTLEDFFIDHENGLAFLYTLPDEATPRKWYFTKGEFTYVKYGIFTVTLTLKECFDILT